MSANPNAPDKEKKTAHYNRARSFYNIGNHQESLKDAEACIKIDPFWAKGYKCKGLALDGLKLKWEAIEVLLDGSKMAEGVDDDYKEIVARLNKETGFLEGDMHLTIRKEKGEKYCVMCDAFEADKRKEFLSCKKCQMVNYCCRGHKEEDEAKHKEVCSELQKIRGDADLLNKVKLLPSTMNEEGIFLIGLEVEGAMSPLAKIANQFSGVVTNVQKEFTCWKEAGKTNIIPMDCFYFPTVKTPDKLTSWEDWFPLPENGGLWKAPEMVNTLTKMMSLGLSLSNHKVGDVTEGTKKALTGALTDPMTVFYALREAKLLDIKRAKVLRIHVVGAEPTKELATAKCFIFGLTSLYGPNLKVAMIGPLLRPFASPQFDSADEEKAWEASTPLTCFGGTYQEYIGTRGYTRPDLIAAFYPGRQFNSIKKHWAIF